MACGVLPCSTGGNRAALQGGEGVCADAFDRECLATAGEARQDLYVPFWNPKLLCDERKQRLIGGVVDGR
jgi:hypothetical protein